MSGTRIGTLLLLAAATVLAPRPAHAQLGGLKKKLDKAVSKELPSTGEAVAFDDLTLELTPEMIAKVVAGKKAGKVIADSPDGPDAIAKRIEALDARQAEIYSKQVNQINAFDARRMDFERCRDSALSEIGDRRRAQMSSDGTTRQRIMQLSMQLQAAMQKNDTATVRRIQEEVIRMELPTAADSGAARAACKVPPEPSAVIKEWMGLKEQITALQAKQAAATAAVQKAEADASGLTDKQLAVACERMLMYIAMYEAKRKLTGFTAIELEALEKTMAAYKDLCR